MLDLGGCLRGEGVSGKVVCGVNVGVGCCVWDESGSGGLCVRSEGKSRGCVRGEGKSGGLCAG